MITLTDEMNQMKLIWAYKKDGVALGELSEDELCELEADSEGEEWLLEKAAREITTSPYYTNGVEVS